MMNHVYVERTFVWCDECLKKPNIAKTISERPLFEIQVDPGSYYGQRTCGMCGAAAPPRKAT